MVAIFREEKEKNEKMSQQNVQLRNQVRGGFNIRLDVVILHSEPVSHLPLSLIVFAAVFSWRC